MRRDLLNKIDFDIQKQPHTALWLEKFMGGNEVTYQAEMSLATRKIYQPTDKQLSDEIKNLQKPKLVEQVAKIKIPEVYNRFFLSWKKNLSSSQLATSMQIGKAYYKIKGRMITGLGGAGVLETSISLHRTYGVPYIPGSAIKGLVSSYTHRKLQGALWRKKTTDHPQGIDHKILFGDTDAAGYVSFFDALPATYSIHPEVMTPHHTDYNGGQEAAPADWDSPTPVPFLSCSGTFLIAFLAPPEWVATTHEILKLALLEEGIGAKTSSGYGRLEVTQEPILPTPQKLEISAPKTILSAELEKAADDDLVVFIPKEDKKDETSPLETANAQARKLLEELNNDNEQRMLRQQPSAKIGALLSLQCDTSLKFKVAQRILELVGEGELKAKGVSKGQDKPWYTKFLALLQGGE